MFHFPDGGVLTETSEVIPGCAWMGAAAAVYIGQATGDTTLVIKSLRMGEVVANVIYDDGGLTTRGNAFCTPESWFVDDVDLTRYGGYTRNRSIWQIIDALDTTHVAAARGSDRGRGR